MSEELKGFSMKLISDIPADVNSEIYKEYEKRFPVYGGEAKYIYSLKENKMLFTKGWEDLLGYRDDELSMKKVGLITDPDQIKFTELINEKSMTFCCSKRDNVDQYSYVYRINKMHKDGSKVPLNWRVSIFKQENGFATEIIGHAQLLPGVPFGKVVYFKGYGPDADEFNDVLDADIFDNQPRCSSKEMDVLALFCEGMTYDQVADRLGVSRSAIEKRVKQMFNRFNVKSNAELISFAYRNRILDF